MQVDGTRYYSYYRLPDDAVQLGKLTKLLVAVQNGEILKYRNKTIEEIELNPEEFISDDENDQEEGDNADTFEDDDENDINDNDEKGYSYYKSLDPKSRITRTSNPTSGINPHQNHLNSKSCFLKLSLAKYIIVIISHIN
ncbi:UNVERIFIED_CONTAM: hypothetical protein RMT77_005153 [Armadillidium vulgare]